MAAKIMRSMSMKRRRRRDDSNKTKSMPAVTVNADPLVPTPKNIASHSSSNGAETAAASGTDKLIAELREHVEQGRIFDARSIVHKLHAVESVDPTSTSELDPIRHLMEEVISQSEHVESLLHELNSDDDWTLAKEKSGVAVHYRREEDSPIHTVRAATTFDNFSPKDFVRLLSLFVETECMHLWFPGGIMKPANLLSWHSKYSKIIQLKISLGLPMISTRDAIVLGSGYHLPDRNAFLIATKTILDDTCRYCDIPKPDKGIVRMATDSIFYVELMKRDVISFKMIGRDDLKLKYMPSSVLNYLSQGHLPFDLMRTVHRTIRNFEGSVWEKKIEERGAYYKEIEEKVYEQLEKWEGDDTDSQMKIFDEGIANANSKLGVQPVAEATRYAGDEDQNRAFDEGAYGSQVDKHHLVALLIFAELSTMAASALCFMAFPEIISTLQQTILHDISETIPSKNLLVATIMFLMLLPFLMLIRLITRAKRAN